MIIFYSLNIIISMMLMLWPLWFSVRWLNLPRLNPFTMAMLVAVPLDLFRTFLGPMVLIDGGLLDKGYQFAILMSSFSTIFKICGIIFFLKLFYFIKLEKFSFFYKSIEFEKIDMKVSCRLFLLLYFFAIYILASSEFGLVNWILNPRQGYQFYRAGQGYWYAIAVSSLSISYILSIVSNLNIKNIIIKTIIYIIYSYLLGSKGEYFSIFTASLFFLWLLKWRYLYRTFFIGAFLVFGIALINLYQSSGDSFELGSIVSYFDHYKNAADYYNAYFDGSLSLFEGDVYLSSFWGALPRAFFPDKPTVYGILKVVDLFYPGMPDLGFTPAFDGAVEYFCDFGFLGVMIFSFFSAQSFSTALISFFIFRNKGTTLYDKVSLSMIAILIIGYAPSFGAYLNSGLYILLLISVLLLLRAVKMFRHSFFWIVK
jgi:hypothetical protein